MRVLQILEAKIYLGEIIAQAGKSEILVVGWFFLPPPQFFNSNRGNQPLNSFIFT